MKHQWLWVILLVCTACRGDATQQPTQLIPPQISTMRTAAIPEEEVPSEIIAAIMAQTQEPSDPNAAALPFQLIGTQPALVNTLNPITNFSELIPGVSVTISGTLHLITDESGATTPVVVDEAENQISVQISPEFLAQYIDQSVQISGIVAQENDRLVLQSPTIMTSVNPQSLPFLQVDPQSPSLPIATFTPETLTLRLAPNLTALATHDALVESLGDELADLDWIGITGMPIMGWTVNFYDTVDRLSIQYIVTPEGTVQRRRIASEPLLCITNNPISRAQVTVDSPQVIEQIGTSEVTITLRALGCDTPPEWVIHHNNLESIPAS